MSDDEKDALEDFTEEVIDVLRETVFNAAEGRTSGTHCGNTVSRVGAVVIVAPYWLKDRLYEFIEGLAKSPIHHPIHTKPSAN